MKLTELSAISPIDGRYATKTGKLKNYFSEYTFFKFRMYIEIQYLVKLIEIIPSLAT